MTDRAGPSTPAPWSVRPERAGDEQAVDAVVRGAFGGPEVPELLTGLRADHCWLGLSFVAESRASPGVVGHVTYTRGWVDAPDRLVDVLVLSPLSVDPRFQRRGVGRALVHRSLDALRDRKEPLVLLEGDPRYYRRLGFEEASRWGLTRPSTRIPEQAFQGWRLPAYDDTVSGALVYPDIFWRHDAVGLR